MIGVALIGLDHMHAYTYARCLLEIPAARLIAIADADEARLREAGRRFEVEALYTRYEAALERKDVQAVVICTANAEHAGPVVAAAQAGKHVLCEKPIATRLADARKMIRACQEGGVVLQIAFVCRYDPLYQTARSLLEDGALGEPLALIGGNRGKRPPGWFQDPAQAGGGAVLDHSVHVTDLMRWFTRDEVVEVYAEIGNLLPPEIPVEDSGLIALRFSRGSIGVVDPSWIYPPSFPTYGDMWMEILGTKGALYLDDRRPVLVLYLREGPPLVRWVSFGADADRAMIEHFLKCVAGEAEPLATGEDGLRALEIALAAYQSAARGQPVQLPLEEEST
ncbi:MAG: Gfo/Idh/MocA family oxidoreductase [Anaerolineae bacterium]|nr:Gfo/Idh/MocA family oxidoreductase [Anaerolineae bacterium]